MASAEYPSSSGGLVVSPGCPSSRDRMVVSPVCPTAQGGLVVNPRYPGGSLISAGYPVSLVVPYCK